jgi:dipeptidase D
MSADFDNLWKTRNIAKVIVGEGQTFSTSLTRSSVEPPKFDLANGLRSAFSKSMVVKLNSGSYPVIQI